ncbi:MAG: hypothetical protein BWK77_03795 [Verrucomicrobia bacterium A1]|nr:MAG: hypothetical protein BWK77_03795 [Verrucomicrobia bacterium A1]
MPRRDSNQIAKRIVDVATGAASGDALKNQGKSKAGHIGGVARAATLSREQRSDIARVAAAARWKKKQD